MLDPLADLAIFYGLDTLDDAETSKVEEQYGDLAEFQAEVAEIQSIAALLAYGVEMVPLKPNLKDRLLQRIAAEDHSQPENEFPAAEPASAAITELLEQSRAAAWKPYTSTPGIEVAMLHLDTERRRVDCFVRSPGQNCFPQHRHADDEEIVVLEGDLMIGGQVYRVGDRIYSQPGTVHQPETLNGCVILVRTSLDDEILT